MNRRKNHTRKAVAGLATTMLCTSALGTDVRNTDCDIHLTLEGSPYTLVEHLEISAFDAGSCEVGQESLTVDDGVVLDMGRYNIRVTGGVLDIRGATLTGSSNNAILLVRDGTVCDETVRGRVTLAGATVSDVDLEARDTVVVTVSDTTFQDTSGTAYNEIKLMDGVSAVFSGADVGTDIHLRTGSAGNFSGNRFRASVTLDSVLYLFVGNTFDLGRFDISELGIRDRTLGEVAGIASYRLVDNVTRGVYDLSPDDANSCEAGQETLTLEDGVELDLGSLDIRVGGGVLDLGRATLTGTSNHARVAVWDGTVCGETVRGRATLTGTTLVDVNLQASETASLTVSNSVFLNSDTTPNLVLVRDDAVATITGTSRWAR